MGQRYAEIQQTAFINAPIDRVRSQFLDLEHHIRTNVHPKLTFKVLSQSEASARYVQEVTLLGVRQRDVFERKVLPDGSIYDRSVEGFNKGGEIRFAFTPEGGGTRVAVAIRLPLPPMIGGLLRGVLERQALRELNAAIEEDRYDLEVRGYQPRAEAALSH